MLGGRLRCLVCNLPRNKRCLVYIFVNIPRIMRLSYVKIKLVQIFVYNFSHDSVIICFPKKNTELLSMFKERVPKFRAMA